MSESSQPRTEREQRLEEVLAEYLRAAESGRPPDREEWLARHPDLADELRSFLANRDRLVQIAGPAAIDNPTMVLGDALAAGSPTLVRYFGDYQLLEEIAQGGMGVVYKARQVSLNRLVALKMILPGQLASATAVQRFRTEAEAAANLDHPAIVPIYEIGEFEGQHYFSMKLIEGGSLAAGAGEGDQRRAAEIVATVARAVHYAHQRGILHRDLKPANILLDENRRPHVTDFGLAKRVEADAGLTQTGSIVGTPSYMPPEQATGQKVLTIAADVYSLGAILYELLTGRPPFRGQTPLETLMQVVECEPEPPHRLRPDVDRDLQTICLTCLAKEPARRYESAAALADELDRWLADEPIQARPASRAERLVKWARRRPALASLLAVSAVSVLVLLTLAGFLWRNAELRAQAVQDLDDAQVALKAAHAATEAERTDAEEANQEAEHALMTAMRTVYAADMHFAHAAWEGDQIPRLLALLERYQPRSDTLSLRGFEWNYLWNASHRDRWTVPGSAAADGSPARVVGLAFSPDSMTLVSADAARKVRRWDAATGKEKSTLPAPAGPLVGLGFSPDGQGISYVLCPQVDGKNLSTRLERTETVVKEWLDGKGTLSLQPFFDTLRQQGQPLAGGSPTAPSPFDPARLTAPVNLPSAAAESLFLTSMGAVTVVRGQLFMPMCVAAAPDGARLAVGGLTFTAGPNAVIKSLDELNQSGAVLVWDVARGQESAFLKGFDSHVTCVAFSGDGKTLAAGGFDRTVRLWDAAGWKELATLRGHTAPVLAVSFSGDGSLLASGGMDGTVRLWDPANGTETGRRRGHRGGVVSLAIAPDGQTLASGGSDGEIKVWDLTRPPPVLALAGNGYLVRALTFTPDSQAVIAGTIQGRIQTWHVADDRELPERSLNEFVAALALGPDNLAAASTLRGLSNAPDGSPIGISDGKSELKLWTGAGPPVSLPGPTGVVQALAFSADGRRLASGGGAKSAGELFVWDVESRQRQVQRPLPDTVIYLAFSPDGRAVAVATADGTVQLLDAASGAERVALEPAVLPPGGLSAPKTGAISLNQTLAGPGRSLAFAADGSRLALAAGDALTVWDMRTGKREQVIRAPGSYFADVAFSPDGQRLAAATGTDVKLWDTHTGLEVITLSGGRGVIAKVAFSPDGQRLAAAGEEGLYNPFNRKRQYEVRVWDATRKPAP